MGAQAVCAADLLMPCADHGLRKTRGRKTKAAGRGERGIRKQRPLRCVLVPCLVILYCLGMHQGF
jgi:hypothetical protein